MTGRVLLKPGVDLSNMAPAGIAILAALKQVATVLHVELTITAGRDGKHAPNSAHYKGEAVDVRSKDLSPQLQSTVLDAVMLTLGTQRFYGVLEGKGTEHEHFHIQRRKGTTFHLVNWLAE